MIRSDRSLLVRSILIVGTLVVLAQNQETAAQIENAALIQREISAPEIQLVAGPASAATPQPDQFVQLLDRAIEITSKRHLTANSHSPWQIFHCILAMRQEAQLRLGNEKVNAIQWFATSEPQFDNQPWLLLTPHGAKFHPYSRMYAFEGHPSQFLALLSQSNLPLEYEFHVQGQVVTLNDLVNNTMKEVNLKEEVTWVLWALQHFLKSDAVWVNQANETWSIERLVQIEANAAVVGAPCGGNHRLFALTRARDKYLLNGGKLRGAWFQADQKIKQHVEIARSLQNSDGSFSSDSYKGPNHTADVNNRFNTTGHTMEFLAIGLPNERLNEPWVRNAVWMLSRELIMHRDTKIDCGPLFHSLDALILYRDRIRPKVPATETPHPSAPLASQVPALSSRIGLNLDADPKVSHETSNPVPEVNSVTQGPPEVEPGGPEPQPISIPIPEPIAVPKLKSVGTNLDPALSVPQTPVPKSSSPTTAAVEPHVGSLKPVTPLIDTSKLANVGQVATPRKSDESRFESPRMIRRDPYSSQPRALLPDLSATPLAEFELPTSKLKLQSDSSHSDAETPSIVRGNGTAEHDEPVSALEPANP